MNTFFQEIKFQRRNAPGKKKIHQNKAKIQILIKYKNYMLMQTDFIPDE